MSLTGFNRLRRMQQVEEMKPENIIKSQETIEPEAVQEAPVMDEKPVMDEIENEVISEIVDETPRTSRRRNNSRRN